jgi:pimeloyl-ACP methyl ester carboxylesterase
MRVEGDGVGLNVEVEGPEDAPAVVFLHGVSMSGTTYDWLPPEVADGRRILRVDQRGHGDSGHAPGGYTIERYGADVVKLIQELAGGRAVLVGQSLGAAVSWWVAQQHPEVVVAALLEDPPLYLGELGEEGLAQMEPMFRGMIDTHTRWHANGLDAHAAAAEFGAQPYDFDPSRGMADALTDSALMSRADGILRMDPGVLEAVMDGSALRGTDTTAPIRVPMLILAADEAVGGVLPAGDIARLAQTHPDVEVRVVPGGGPGIHHERENRDTYLEHLVPFLAQHAPPRS